MMRKSLLLKVVVILVVRLYGLCYVLVSLLLSLVRYGFVEVWGCFHGPSCIVLQILQVFMRIRGRGLGSLDPPDNRRNIVDLFPCNAGPVKNHKVASLAFNVGPSSVCQQIQWRFAGGPMSSR